MKTLDFKPKTIMEARKFPSKEKTWVIGLDIGYSAVKGFCPNKLFSFPSYARQIPENRERMKAYGDTDICYRDRNGLWSVGSLAYEEVVCSEVADSEEELYGRNRYYSPMFMVLARTGIALGMISNLFGSPNGKKVVIQTGLPPKYRLADTPILKEVLAGKHSFDIRIGNGKWQHFDFELEENDIYVMPQPLGSLVSASIDKDGKQIPEAAKYFSSNLVIFDPGFGTMDDYTVKQGNVVGNGETFSNLGMHEVFERTCKDIRDIYGVTLQVPELINKLDSGTVYITDRRKMKRVEKEFTDFLTRNSKQVCEEAVEQMKVIHDYFSDINYIITTGGTYDAWKEDFDSKFAEMEGLHIIPGNANDDSIINVFSNVRGYYFYLLNRMK